MTPTETMTDAQARLKSAVQRFGEELKKMRTGRAHASMLDGVMVEAYGQQMPLNQVGNVTAPEATLLQITPFDPNNLEAISAAIRDNQQLGLNPSDDGRVVRIQIPPLTEERRREMVKVLNGKVEDAMVQLRQIRHDTREKIDAAEKAKDLGQDEAKRMQKQLEEAMDQAKKQLEEAAKAKEHEMLTV